ncbi:MAG: CBS domain-containing protein [bacterium]|nr:CBS domain-containing protein [bacterium]
MTTFFEKPVREVMSDNLLTIDIKRKASDAVAMLNEHKVGLLLVTLNGKIFGAISETDIVRKVVAEGLAPEKVSIEKLVSMPPVSIDHKTPIHEAYYAMACWKVRHLLVTDKGKEIGLISVRDILYPREAK